jgi:hypothetical protein
MAHTEYRVFPWNLPILGSDLQIRTSGPRGFETVTQAKDFLLLAIVTFMTVAFILPEDSFLRGLDRSYILTGLMVIVIIALSHYSKLVVVASVLIVAIGANLPQDIALTLNLDVRILMIALIAILLVAMANLIIKLPTGLDKPQGFPARKGSGVPNPNIVELNLPVELSTPVEFNTPENHD